MSELVPAEQIEQIVGAHRHRTLHIGRAVSAEQTVYILHSHECRDSGIDLRECGFSIALDRGITAGRWVEIEDRPVLVGIEYGRLVPWSDLSAYHDDWNVQLITEESSDER